MCRRNVGAALACLHNTTSYLYVNYPITALNWPLGLQEVRASRISIQSANDGVRFVSPTHRLPLLTRRHPWYAFLSVAESTQGHTAAKWINSMKNLNDHIRNRTHDLSTSLSALTLILRHRQLQIQNIDFVTPRPISTPFKFETAHDKFSK
jgi:hypothetical protein